MKKILVRKNFGGKKYLVEKKIWWEKIVVGIKLVGKKFNGKKIWWENNFGGNISLVEVEVGCDKNLGMIRSVK